MFLSFMFIEMNLNRIFFSVREIGRTSLKKYRIVSHRIDDVP